MSYGLQVWNADGRKQIDSDEIAPNTFLSSPVTTAYTAMSYPPAGFSAGDLVCARPQSTSGSTAISIGRTISNVPQFFGSKAINDAISYEYVNTAGIVTALVKTQAGNIGSPATGEFGMDVYSTDGTTVLFSATRSRSVKVLAQGVLAGGQSFTYSLPSNLSFNKIYAVVNSTHSMAIAQSFLFPSWGFAVQYLFYPAASTPYVTVRNTVSSGGQNISGWVGGMFAYMLVYDTN